MISFLAVLPGVCRMIRTLSFLVLGAVPPAIAIALETVIGSFIGIAAGLSTLPNTKTWSACGTEITSPG